MMFRMCDEAGKLWNEAVALRKAGKINKAKAKEKECDMVQKKYEQEHAEELARLKSFFMT